MDEKKKLRIVSITGEVREIPDGYWDNFRIIDSLLFLKKGDDYVDVYNLDHLWAVEYS